MNRWILPANTTTAADLRLESAEAREPGPNQVRVRVTALSINARDQMIVRGPFGRTPGQGLVPLSDVAGRIEAVGPGVSGWASGDRVMTAHVPSWLDGQPPAFGIGAGSLDDPGVAAEQLILDADRLIAVPEALSDEEASTLQVAGVTAWNSVFGDHPVQAGDRVLVIGSGGVSLFAAQLARAAGAEVHAAVRSQPEDPRWEQVGVSSVTTTTEGWGQRFFEATGGADKIVNAVGPGILNECLAALRSGGEVATPGLYDLTPPALDGLSMIGKQTSVRGVAVGSVAMHRDLAAFMTQHDLHPIINHRVPFGELPQAYDLQGGSGLFGKIVINVP